MAGRIGRWQFQSHPAINYLAVLATNLPLSENQRFFLRASRPCGWYCWRPSGQTNMQVGILAVLRKGDHFQRIAEIQGSNVTNIAVPLVQRVPIQRGGQDIMMECLFTCEKSWTLLALRGCIRAWQVLWMGPQVCKLILFNAWRDKGPRVCPHHEAAVHL